MKLFGKIVGILVILLILCSRTQVVFAGNPPDAAQSSITGTETLANNSDLSTITVTLKDSGGVALAGDTVSISASDSAALITPGVATLDASGQATFSMRTSTSGTISLSVTDVTTSTTLVALGSVIFDPVHPPVDHNASNTPACSDATPVGAPDLYQVTPKETSTTLYFAPPNTKYTGFLVSYGLTSSADSYSVRFDQVQSSGAISYTVGSLHPKTAYYFKVRAVNGCAYGPWSQTVASLNVSNIKKLPETGPNQLVLLGGLGGVVALIGAMMIFVL